MDATAEELAEVLYVDPGDIRAVLAALGEPVGDVIPQWLCGEVSEYLDPWPLVRQVPDVYRRP